jgi:hypothetical protein
MRPIDADRLLKALEIARERSVGIYGDLGGAVSGCMKHVMAAPTLEGGVDQPEAEENAPLTIEQLRGMNGEPVWWWNKSQKPTCMICVYDKFGKFNTEPVFVNFDFAAEDAAKITSYSRMKKWGYKPYRRKPHSPQKTED